MAVRVCGRNAVSVVRTEAGVNAQDAAWLMKANLLYAGAWDATVGVLNTGDIAFVWEAHVNGDVAHGHVYLEGLQAPEPFVRSMLRSEARHALRSLKEMQ